MANGEDELTYSNIAWGHSDGVLTLQNNLVSWRSKSTEVLKKFQRSDLAKWSWITMGSTTNCIVKLFLSNDKVIRFRGFKNDDYNDLTTYCKSHYNQVVEKEDWSSAGGNWGNLNVSSESLTLASYDDNDTTLLEIPLDQVSQCALPNKNEVELQFHEDDTVAADEETLAEMRLYVPPNLEDDESAADVLKSEILQKANISHVSGKSIVELDESIGTFLTPRGRYAIEMYKKFMRMHGKTYDYKIMYTNINRCFLLERPDGVSSAFVISLEEPIRQGKQGYPHLVMQLKKTETQIDLNITKEDLEAYGTTSLSERMTGLLPQVVATLFKYLVQKKVYTSGKFKTHADERAVKCALKAQEGLLYPLEKSFMFIHKPTNFIRYEEVLYVEFQRYSGQTGSSASRNFDLLVKCKGLHPGDGHREFLFSAIDRREFPELSQFLSSKKLKVRNMPNNESSSQVLREALGPEEGEIDEEEEDEDSDFGPGEEESSSEEEEEDSSDDGESAAKKQKKE